MKVIRFHFLPSRVNEVKRGVDAGLDRRKRLRTGSEQREIGKIGNAVERGTVTLPGECT